MHPGRILALALLATVSLAAPGVAQEDAAARCWRLAGLASRNAHICSEGCLSSSIVTSAQLDCQKGHYDRGIAALEKYLRDQHVDFTPRPPASTPR